MTQRTQAIWTFAIVSIALFMTTLDNLVVTTALPTIQRDLHASVSELEWTVNAYTLTFAVLLMMGAALGDRFGRKRLFLIGLVIFTAGLGGGGTGAIHQRVDRGPRDPGGRRGDRHSAHLDAPVGAVPAEKRGVALGAWGGISGLGVALGPVIGGAIVQGISWQWIFWLNVPFGLIALPLGAALPARELRACQVARSGWRRSSYRGHVRDRVRSGARQQRRLVEPGDHRLARDGVMLTARSWPGSCAHASRCCRWASSAAGRSAPANASSLMMFFGMFGSIFLLTQYLQNVQGYSA